MKESQIAPWASDIVRCPNTQDRLDLRDIRMIRSDGTTVARVEHGILRFSIPSPGDSIQFYRNVGGAHFHERAVIPFAMSSLDTPVYHSFIDEVLPLDADAIIVDVGGGDGRNAQYCLKRGCKRVVVIDAAGEALMRFRARISDENPSWLDRVLLIEADARNLPLSSGFAGAVIAIETLYYLNEDYEVGLKECIRLMSPMAKIMLSERDYEGGLVLRLVYDGLGGMLEAAQSRSLWDGTSASLVRTRSFSEAELLKICRAAGLQVLRVSGTPLLTLLLGYLNGRNALTADDAQRLPDVSKLLLSLAKEGAMRRCHVIIAQRKAI